MKQITVHVSGTVRVSTDGGDTTAANALLREARRNRHKVIEGANTVERVVAQMISFYFFGHDHERIDEFESLILNSDSCSFAAKRKLILHIVKEKGLLEGKAKSDYEQLLQRTMAYRNAFTHGSLLADEGAVWLSYFEGSPRKDELTDDFLTKVETTLRTAWEKSLTIEQKLGVTTLLDEPPQDDMKAGDELDITEQS